MEYDERESEFDIEDEDKIVEEIKSTLNDCIRVAE